MTLKISFLPLSIVVTVLLFTSFSAIQAEELLGSGQSMAMDNAGFTIPDIALPPSLNNAVNNNVQSNLGASNNLPPTTPDPVVNEMATPLQDSSFDNLSGPGQNLGVDDTGGIDTNPDIPAELNSATDPAVQNGLAESQQQADAELAADAAADEANNPEDPAAEDAANQDEAPADENAPADQTESENQTPLLEDTTINLDEILQELSPN